MVLKDTARFRQMLAERGHHVTQPREVVFTLLLNSPSPQSMSELIAKASGQVDRVSVYRNIELFEELGIVHRIYVGWKYKLELSDQFLAHHHHLICLNCGKVIDIEDEKHLEEFTAEVAKRFGFQPRGHQFEIDGYCKECLSKETIRERK